MLRSRIVAIVRLPELASKRAIELAEVLASNGIPVVEFTLNTPDALEAVGAVATALGDRCVVGAGTVLDVAEAEQALEAGARFVVSPHTDPELIATVNAGGAVSVPGALTATELQLATGAGADLVKIFPAGPVGPGYLKALLGPFRGARLVPTGGLELDDVPRFLDAGAVAVGLGTPLIGSGEPEEVAQRARRAVELTEVPA